MLIYKIGIILIFITIQIFIILVNEIAITLLINILVGLSDIYGYILILTNVFIFNGILKHTLDLKKQVNRLMKNILGQKILNILRFHYVMK